jgi:hypothetical protein
LRPERRDRRRYQFGPVIIGFIQLSHGLN